MTSTRRERRPAGQFADSRANAAREQAAQRGRAAHTVAGNAQDLDDYVRLVSMLGLDDTIGAALTARLAGYVRQVALAVGIPAEATGYEVSDTATAYLALSQHLFEHPGRDLMLVWDERLGWSVGVETNPGETPVVVGYLGGAAVQTPAAIARFVADAVAGRCTTPIRPVLPPTTRSALANQMAQHAGN